MNETEIIAGMEQLLSDSKDQADQLTTWIESPQVGEEDMLEFRKAMLVRVVEETHILEQALNFILAHK